MSVLFLEEILKEGDTEKKLKAEDYLFLNTSIRFHSLQDLF